MDVLGKIKSATLLESLIATVIIVVIFMIASLILNNLLINTYSKNTHIIDYRINELDYQIRHGKIELPYVETYKDWDVSVNQDDDMFTIYAKRSGKEIVKYGYVEE